jgi:hypothetical protein
MWDGAKRLNIAGLQLQVHTPVSFGSMRLYEYSGTEPATWFCGPSTKLGRTL